MKFERILNIYWLKGFFYNGKLTPFSIPNQKFFFITYGIKFSLRQMFIERFEIKKKFQKSPLSLVHPVINYNKTINILFSQLSSVNNSPSDLTRFNLIRLFLTKTFRGRSHALGKPSRGQRTWSNAWTSYKNNFITRSFLYRFQKILVKQRSKVKINYKLIQKITKKKKLSVNITKKNLSNIWF